jgi:aminoglycoside 2''-phosphotransferase
MVSERLQKARSPPPISSVRQGLDCCFPDLADRRIRPVPSGESGWDSFAYFVGAEHLLKIARLPARPEMFTLLRQLGPMLSRRLPLRIPLETHSASRCPTLGVPLTVTSLVHGVQLTQRRLRRLSGTDRRRAASDLGGFLSALHRTDLGEARRAGAHTYGRIAMLWVWDRVRRHVLPKLGREQRQWARRLFLEHLDDQPFWRFPLRFVHKDLCDSHIILRGPRVAGVIDWGDAGIGDAAEDFGGLIMSYGQSFAREAMRRYHSPSEGLIRRPVEFYLKTIPLQHIDFGTRTGQPELVRGARRALDKVMRGEWPRP